MRSPGAESAVGDHSAGETDSSGVDDDTVDLPFPHHLGVAGQHGRAGLQASRLHGLLNALEIRTREADFDDHRTGQAEDIGHPHHREVVDRTRDGESPDVTPGEEDRVDDVRVGGDHEPAIPNAQGGTVVHRR